MSEQFDVAVLGSGPGGYVAALKAAALGASVAVVEQSELGGTCLNAGCIPSKALLASAERVHQISHAAELGINVSGEVSVDWTKVQKRKDKVLRMLRNGIKSLFASRKVQVFAGRGVLNGAGRISVTKKDGTVQEVAAKNIVLAVGSIPSRIPGWPNEPERVCTSNEALHWKTLPKRLLVVGGGYIGCEFACMMHEFGVHVTVVEMLPTLVPNVDRDLADGLAKVFKQRGIPCFTDTKVKSLAIDDDSVKAALSTGDTIQVDKVLVATGRQPNTKDIGLESVGLETDRGFVRVNDRMETAVKGTYCIGDANGRCLLAHAASAMGEVAVTNALGGDRVYAGAIPACVYTFPEMATVGLSEEQANEKGLPIAVGMFPIGHLGKAMAVGDTDGFAKVIRHRETGELLAVHMMGHNVTEVIAAAAAMMGRKVSVRDLAETVFAHPTISEAVKESAVDALGMALHLPPRKVVKVVAG